MTMTSKFVAKKLVALCLCVLLTAGAWIPLVTTDRENTTTDTDLAWDVRITGNREGGNGTKDNPFLIYTVEDLQAVKGNLTAHYALANDINASATIAWNDGAGFIPVGDSNSLFIGSLDGRKHTITGLFIDRPSTKYVGLFGYIGSGGSVNNVGLEDVDIIGSWYVGGLVGHNAGSVENCYATGRVNGTDWYVGGLVGTNSGSVKNCYATGSVTGTASSVGGIGRDLAIRFTGATACENDRSGPASEGHRPGARERMDAGSELELGWRRLRRCRDRSLPHEPDPAGGPLDGRVAGRSTRAKSRETGGRIRVSGSGSLGPDAV